MDVVAVCGIAGQWVSLSKPEAESSGQVTRGRNTNLMKYDLFVGWTCFLFSFFFLFLLLSLYIFPSFFPLHCESLGEVETCVTLICSSQCLPYMQYSLFNCRLPVPLLPSLYHFSSFSLSGPVGSSFSLPFYISLIIISPPLVVCTC